MSHYIKSPDGRIVAAPRGMVKSEIVDGNLVTAVNPKALKPGWSIATHADLAAKAGENAAIEKRAAIEADAAKPENVIAAAIRAASVAPSAKKGT